MVVFRAILFWLKDLFLMNSCTINSKSFSEWQTVCFPYREWQPYLSTMAFSICSSGQIALLHLKEASGVRFTPRFDIISLSKWTMCSILKSSDMLEPGIPLLFTVLFHTRLCAWCGVSMAFTLAIRCNAPYAYSGWLSATYYSLSITLAHCVREVA